jgi:4-amino-4-deoxy-L-arabinose transferase-like glycosyltransferase
MRRIDPALVAILVAAAALRVHGLVAQSVDLDESSSVWLSGFSLRALLFHNLDHGNPPLYYVFLKGWTAIFGAGEVAIRLPSALFSTATVGATYALGRALHGRAVARLGALLVALSSCQLAWGQDARMYPLVALLGVTTTHALWAAVTRGGRARHAAYVVLAAAGAYTHFQGLVVVLAHAVALVVARASGRPARPGLVPAGLALLLLLAPIGPLYLAGGLLAVAPGDLWQPHASPAGVAALSVIWVAGAGLVPSGALWPLVVLPLPLVLAVLCARRGASADALFLHLGTLTAGVVGFVALASVMTVWHPRYLAAFHPLFLLGLALCARLAAGVATGAPFVALALVGLVHAKLGRGTKQDWRAAAAIVDAPGQVFVLGPRYLGRPLGYYRRAPFEVLDDPGLLVERVTRTVAAGSPAFVVYSDEHRPPDPERRSAALLAERLEVRAATDLVGLHVYELAPR